MVHRCILSYSAGRPFPSSLLTPSCTATGPTGIFGVPLQDSIRYANVAISLFNDEGQSYIYGYVPIVVAKCGVFLKEKGELRLDKLVDFCLLTLLCSHRCRRHLQVEWLGKTNQGTEDGF